MVQYEVFRPRRSIDQNSFLHAVPLRMICDQTGMEMNDIKDFLLMEAFGTQEHEVMGRTIVRPTKRSSQLNTKEFSWFLEWIEQWAVQTLGLVIPKPNEVIT
jgi:hypothetical protein